MDMGSKTYVISILVNIRIRHSRKLWPNDKYRLHIFVDHEVAYIQVDWKPLQKATATYHLVVL